MSEGESKDESKVIVSESRRDALYQHLLHLHNIQAITLEQYKTLYKQLGSRDLENHVIVEETIAQLISKL